MADFYVFGVPNGFDASSCNEDTLNFLQNFYVPHDPGFQFKVIRRPNNDVHYIFLVYENPGRVFGDVNGRGGAFFGMSMVLHNQYFSDANKIKQLMRAVYDNYIKNTIIQEDSNGVRKYIIPSLRSSDDRVANYIIKGFTKILQNNPQLNLSADIKPLPPLTNQPQRH